MFSGQQTLACQSAGLSVLASMKDFLLTTPAQLVIWATVLLVLMSVGGTSWSSGNADDDRLTANELLTNFQELHLQGDINDAEYRTIKTALGAKLREELEDSENKG